MMTLSSVRTFDSKVAVAGDRWEASTWRQNHLWTSAMRRHPQCATMQPLQRALRQTFSCRFNKCFFARPAPETENIAQKTTTDNEVSLVFVEMETSGPFPFVRFLRGAKLLQHVVRLLQPDAPNMHFTCPNRQRCRRQRPC